MRLVLHVIAAFLLCVLRGGVSEILNADTELLIYRERIKAVTHLLQERCPKAISSRLNSFPHKRAVLSHDLQVAIERAHLNRLEDLLADCHAAQIKPTPTISWSKSTALKTVPPTSVLPTTDVYTTTISVPETTTFNYSTMTTGALPFQCTSSSTKNLTESWRTDIGGNLKPLDGFYSSDVAGLDEGRTWFRFMGAAGSQLLNKCPLHYSCGVNGPHWSDDAMPNSVGESSTISIYESFDEGDGSECRKSSVSTTVTRCSAGGDFVYRIDGAFSGGPDAVCGMTV